MPASSGSCLAALVALRIAQPIRSASSSAFNVSSTLPRTTRSRWFLIRSSSIVMTFPSGLGVISVVAAPSCCPSCPSLAGVFGQLRKCKCAVDAVASVVIQAPKSEPRISHYSYTPLNDDISPCAGDYGLDLFLPGLGHGELVKGLL
jgi:hypothetical protein